VVVTAGHCVYDTDLIGENGQWNAHELFIPGFRDGKAPYGSFVARAGVVHSQWLLNDQIDSRFDAYDQAFLVLGRNEHGARAGDVAEQNIGLNEKGSQYAYEFGYPRASAAENRTGRPEFTGLRLAYCYGPAHADPGSADFPEPAGLWGNACVMGGGSSGGPRIVHFNRAAGVGTVAGVNTQGVYLNGSGAVCDDPAGCTRHLVGPQFTSSVTGPLLQAASR
jgi:hypothetical protein